MRFTVDANDRASATFAKIAAAAERLEKSLKGLNKTVRPTVKLNGAAAVKRDVAAIRRDMDRIRNVTAKVKVSVAGAGTLDNLDRKLDKLSDAHVAVHVSITPPGVEARLQSLNTLLRNLRGTTEHTVVVNERGSASTMARLSGLAKSLVGAKGLVPFTNSLMAVGAAATAASASLGGMIAAVATLGGSLAGTVPILVAGAGMIGGVLATLKVGTQGLSFAFEALAEGDMKKWGKALANLSPEAQKFAVSIKDVWGQLRQMKGAVQDNLFAGMGEAVSKLARTELPMLQKGMGGVATELNLAAKSVMEYIGSSEGIARQEVMWANTATVVQNLRPWLTNVTAAMFDIGEVGSTVLADITGGAGEAGLGFRKMIAEARRSGELEQAMRAGVETLRQLGSVAGNVGSILKSVFIAARTSGADFLTTLDRGTEALANFMRSGAGQTALVDFFRESRATLDGLQAGLVAAAKAAAAFVSAFSNTGGLSDAGRALSDLMVAVAPLAETLGRLAGETLGVLASAASTAAGALSPLVGLASGVVSAMGPLAPSILAVVVAFKGLSVVNGMITGLGASLAGFATRLGASAAVASGLTRTFSAVGTAAQGLGVALVIAAAAWDAITVSASEAARAMDAGGAAARDAASGLAAQTAAMDGLKNSTGPMGDVLRTVGEVMDFFTDSTDEARASMTPLQQAQMDAATAANVHALAVQQFTASSPQARAAAEALATANDRVAAEQDKASSSAKTHADAIRDLSGAMQSQIGAALAYEDAVRRTAEAHQRAGDALKESGAKSDAYQKSVTELARSQEQQAQVAQKVADATLGAEAGLQAYNVELLRLNDGTQQGRDAFVKIASSLGTTELGLLSAAAAATGLKTEILTLPDGRTVTVVTAADTAKLEQVKADLNAVAAQEWVSTITFVGDPTRVNDTLQQTIQFANGQQATLTLNANNQPVLLTVGQTKYHVDATTGVMTIDGNPAPGDANLNGFKLRVDATTGAVTIEAVTAPADAARTEVQQPTQSTHTIDPNAAPAQGAVQGLQQPSSSEHTVNPNAAPAQGAVDGLKAPTASTHTINVDSAAVNTAKSAAEAATASIHTINVDAGPVQQAIDAAQVATQSLHTLNVDDKAVTDAKSRAEQATQSLHTINCNDSAVTSAKNRARQNTSSTHTINVVVRGAAPPRAAGAYTTPRAQGAYAAPMAAGGMRRMSGARAEIVPPRQPRIIGDRMRGDEAFIPVNRSARSQAILSTTADRMGYDLVPRNAQAMPDTGTAASVSLSSIRSAIAQRGTTSGGGALVSAVQQLSGQLRALRGDVDHHGDNAAIVQELRALRSLLAQGGTGGSAAARAQTSRTLSELGAF
jgi:trimeric autotransporter adhesin